MTLHDAVQVYLFVLGVAARWIVGKGTHRAVWVSLWVSVANLPAWFWLAWETHSWGLGALNVIYAGLYARALVNTQQAIKGQNMEHVEASEPRNPLIARALNEYVVDGVLALDTQTDLIAQGYDLESVEEWCARSMTIGQE